MLEKKFIYATQKIQNKILKEKIVLIMRNNEKGSEGIIVNADKIMEVELEDSKEQKIKAPVYLGGLYSTGGLYLVHAYEDLLFEDSEIINTEKINKNMSAYEEEIEVVDRLIITENIYFGSNNTFMKIKERKIGEKHKFYSGQMYWPKHRLQMEIQSGYWEIMDEFDSNIFYEKEKAEEAYKKSRWINKPRINWLFDPPPFFDERLN